MTNNTAADVADDAIPGYRAARAALDAVQTRAHQLRLSVGQHQAADLPAAVVASALAGRGVPADLGDQVAAQVHSRQYAEAEAAILAAAAQRITDHTADVRRTGADDGIRALQPHLGELIAEAAGLAAQLPARVRSESDATDAGPEAFSRWYALGPLTSRYVELRCTWEGLLRDRFGDAVEFTRAQRAEMSAPTGVYQLHDVLAVAGEMSNLDEVWPRWRDSRASDGTPGARPPWPGPYTPGERLSYPHRDRAYLRWLATNRVVRPWLPTSTELRAAYVANTRAAQLRHLEAEEVRKYGRSRTPQERAAANQQAANDADRQLRSSVHITQ